jgi:hypothetical protein
VPLSDIANISISTSGGGLSLPGFGTALILGGYSKTWPERVRTYGGLADLTVDFAVGTPEYIAGAAIFGQNPRPTTVKVGRGTLKPTQKWTLTPDVSTQAVQTYRVKIAGVAYDFVSDATPSAAEVVTGLIAVINAATGVHGLTASGATTLVLTAAQGAWQEVEVGDVNLLSLEQDHADPGVATDLAAIQLETADWYGLITLWNSKACVLAAAAWAEANEKLYVAQTQDTPCIAVAEGGATDVMKSAKTAAYARTSLWYDPSNKPVLDAGLVGRMFPEDAGSETWALKTIAGALARTFTGTHLANLKAKYGNWYYSIAGANVTSPDSGRVSANEWIDVIRGRDALKVDMQGRIFDRLRSAKKIAYTDAGATIVEGEIKASLTAFTGRGFIAEGSWAVTTPKVATQSSTDRGNRYFPGIAFTGNLAGAIHKLAITGALAA